MSRSRQLLTLWILALPLGTATGQVVVPPAATPADGPAIGPATGQATVPATAPADAPRWDPEERAAIECLRSLRKKERPSDDELAARLSRAGERLVPLFFDVLAERSVPALDAESKPQILSEVQEHAVLLGLGQLERDPVLTHVAGALLAPAEPRLRRAALACVGAVGHANDLPQLLALALAPEERAPDETLMEALRSAVTAVLLRDPRAVEQLVQLRRITRPELLPELVRAVGATRDPRGLAYLSEVAYWHENAVLDVLNQVPALGPSGDEQVDQAMKVRARAYLDESNAGLCRAAITALAALRDQDAIGALIPLLVSANTGLAQNAHWALRKLTGLALAPEPKVWERWHQAELFWLVRWKPQEFQRLRKNDPAVAADALRAILEHPLARRELTSALPDLLKSRASAIRVLACRTLADLEAQEAVGRLVWALEDPEREVSEAAHTALCKLTHLTLPRDPQAWQSATNTAPRGTEL